jgi:hypothetical protein
MAQASVNNSRPDAAAQFSTRGYVLNEDANMILTDMFKAMEATAFAYDMDSGGSALNFDLSGDQVASVLRSFARLGRSILLTAPWADTAMARARDAGGS